MTPNPPFHLQTHPHISTCTQEPMLFPTSTVCAAHFMLEMPPYCPEKLLGYTKVLHKQSHGTGLLCSSYLLEQNLITYFPSGKVHFSPSWLQWLKHFFVHCTQSITITVNSSLECKNNMCVCSYIQDKWLNLIFNYFIVSKSSICC